MDFTQTEKNPDIHLDNYFGSIVETFKLTGREVTIKKKDKKTFGKVESAFLKDNTDVYDISFQTEKTPKVKIELDTNPPLGFETEEKMNKISTKVGELLQKCVEMKDDALKEFEEKNLKAQINKKK